MSRVFLLAIAFLACSRAPAAEVKVFAAASLSDALKEIGAAYEKRGGDRVVFNFAGSGILARQIANDAPADLFASADAERMDMLQRDNLIDQSTRVSFLSNSLVFVVRRERSGPVILESLERIAIADPLIVPAGTYAKGYLRNIGMWEKLASRMIPTENVRAAMAAVEAGNADGAFVYRTDALTSSAVRIAFEASPNKVPPITYPFAVTAGAEQPAAARRFLSYLATKPALDVFRRNGFIVRK